MLTLRLRSQENLRKNLQPRRSTPRLWNKSAGYRHAEQMFTLRAAGAITDEPFQESLLTFDLRDCSIFDRICIGACFATSGRDLVEICFREVTVYGEIHLRILSLATCFPDLGRHHPGRPSPNGPFSCRAYEAV
jgi:hypothetical protein